MKVCLTMIVKDESHVIERCLTSCKPHINAWCIVDTGSTDGTQDKIRSIMQDLPGELHERSWVDFSTNRNQALDLAYPHGDYLLTIDADERFEGEPLPRQRVLHADAYHLPVLYDGTRYTRCALISTKLRWNYVGVVHEYLESDRPAFIDNLDSPRIVVTHDGARSKDPDTYKKDAALLEAALAAEPHNARYAFYLAQSYKDSGELLKAKDAYAHRATMIGWNEETWYAFYEFARLSEWTGSTPDEVCRAYLRAYQYLPHRAEALYQLGRFHRQRREFDLAYLYLRHASTLAKPPSGLFVDAAVYDWKCWDELGIVAYYVGRTDEGMAAVSKALATAPQQEQERLQKNYSFYKT